MSRTRRLWRFVTNLLLGSAVATRAGGGAPPERDPEESALAPRWDLVRREAYEAATLEGLPPEVRQFLPGHGPHNLDVPTSIRLSFAAAERRHFPILERYWSERPGIDADVEALQALTETRRWLGSEDGLAAELFSAGFRRPSPLTDLPAFDPELDVWQVEGYEDITSRNRHRDRHNDDDDGGYDDD